MDKSKPRIAVYGICRNEEKYIDRWLKSVQDADEIVLCDMGPSDQTDSRIKQFAEANTQVPLKIYSICVSPWRFDDARNTALSLVSPDIDICISLDMDEYLMDNWKPYLTDHWDKSDTRYTHKWQTLGPNGDAAVRENGRIHTRTGYMWKLPVYETLEFQGIEQVMDLPDFWIYHEPDQEKSKENYLPLLEQSVKERKDVWNSWKFLSLEYVYAGKYQEALNALQHASNLESTDKSYVHKIQFLIYRAQQQPNLALLSLNNSILYMPERREPYFEKALYLHQLGRHAEAWFTLQEAEKFVNTMIDDHYSSSAWGDAFEGWKTKISKLAKAERSEP